MKKRGPEGPRRVASVEKTYLIVADFFCLSEVLYSE